MSVVAAGLLYAGSIFVLGFGFGLVRTWALSAMPNAARLEAVLVELPVMLAASWFACRLVLWRLSIPATVGARLSMGVTAFLLMQLAEIAVSTMLLGLTMAEHLHSYRDLSYALGLAAQIAFAAFPLIQLGKR